MPITSDTTYTLGYAEKTGLTAGNEYVFMIPENTRVLVTAKGDSGSAAANLYFSINYRGTNITDISTFDQQFASDQLGSMSLYANPGVTHLALKITSGTWRMRIRTLSIDGE